MLKLCQTVVSGSVAGGDHILTFFKNGSVQNKQLKTVLLKISSGFILPNVETVHNERQVSLLQIPK